VCRSRLHALTRQIETPDAEVQHLLEIFMKSSNSWSANAAERCLPIAAFLALSLTPLGAQAMSMNGRSQGGALVYPYYTVNDGNSTILSVVNSTADAKAIKVAFREGLAARDVFQFNLYLSAYDVWTAALFANTADGPALLQTFDNSCTVPDLRNPPSNLNPVTLPNSTRAVPLSLNSSVTALQTREGHFTMVEMGILATGSLSEAHATHVGGIPGSCAGLVDAWVAGLPNNRSYWTTNVNADLAAPTDGLAGFAAVVDIASGVMYGYSADAIQKFSDAIQHTNPTLATPSITDAVQAGAAPTTSIIDDDSRVITSRWSNPAQAVSALFMTEYVRNDYTIDNTSADAFDSEWVLTFPTKRAHSANATAVAPFRVGTGANGPGTACEPYAIFVYDREENVYDVGSGVPTRPTVSMCRATQVLAFGDDNGGISDILGAPAAALGDLNGRGGHINFNTQSALGGVVLDPAFTAGWAWLSFRSVAGGFLQPSPSMTSVDGDTYIGLPVTGFWAFAANNTTGLPGVRAYYGAFIKHRAEVNVTCAAAGCVP
jgi:hypothetical protein